MFAADGVLQSRRHNDLAVRFPEIMTAAGSLGDVVSDGGLVALRDGRLDFGSLAAHDAAMALAVRSVLGCRLAGAPSARGFADGERGSPDTGG